MDKLGVFYTLGFLILILIFLSFIAVVNKDYSSTAERVGENFGYEKIRNIDQSIQEGFVDIFSLTSGIVLSKTLDSVIFRETLPNPSSTNFKNNLSNYKTFIESNYSSIFLNIQEINTNLPLIVKYYGIKFSHPSYGGGVLDVTYEQNNFNGFTLTITTDETLDSSSCSGSGSSSDPYLNVNAFGVSGSCSQNGVANLELFNTDTPRDRLAVVDLSGNVLTITEDDEITVELEVDGLDPIGEAILVETPENVLNFYFDDFRYLKNGTIRVL